MARMSCRCCLSWLDRLSLAAGGAPVIAPSCSSGSARSAPGARRRASARRCSAATCQPGRLPPLGAPPCEAP